MALKIRLRQQGRKNRVFYRLVVADSRSPRDGKYVEALGWYNPIEEEAAKKWVIDEDRIQHWLNVGAQMTENAGHLIRQGAPALVQGIADRERARRVKAAARRKAGKQVQA